MGRDLLKVKWLPGRRSKAGPTDADRSHLVRNSGAVGRTGLLEALTAPLLGRASLGWGPLGSHTGFCGSQPQTSAARRGEGSSSCPVFISQLTESGWFQEPNSRNIEKLLLPGQDKTVSG